MTPEKAKALLDSVIPALQGTHTAADVLEQIDKGNLQLWLGENCIGVTEICRYPRLSTINIFLAAGDMREFRELQHGIESYGRGRGATRLTFHGRATKKIAKLCGWQRSGEGFKAGFVMYSKEI